MRIVVIGGGLSGLAAAHRAQELARESGVAVELVVLEASGRTGGVIATERTDEFLLELGPDSFIREKPWALDLCRRLGLEGELVPTRPGDRRTLVVRAGRLEPLPEGFQLLAPARPLAVLTSRIFSPGAKLGMLRDLLAPRGAASRGGDESLADFVRRRFGPEVLERVAQPLVGGIYTADPETLSMAATLPRFVEMEREHRSLLVALRSRAASGAADPGASGARFGLFVTLRRGVASLIEALERALPAGAVRTSAAVRSLVPPLPLTSRTGTAAGNGEPASAGGRWSVELESGERLEADAVIVTTPAHVASGLTRALDPALAAHLAAIPYASSAIVTLAYRRTDVARPLDFFGFVVPFAERRRIIACSLSSVKYPGRAPDDVLLLRAFVGGALQPELFELDDASMVAAVRDELRQLLGITAEPRLVRVGRWPRSMPQYLVGHLDRVAEIERCVGRWPGLFLAGAAYRGVGMADAVRTGEEAAGAALARLGGGPLAVEGAGRQSSA